jgi:hypothetical protein
MPAQTHLDLHHPRVLIVRACVIGHAQKVFALVLRKNHNHMILLIIIGKLTPFISAA